MLGALLLSVAISTPPRVIDSFTDIRREQHQRYAPAFHDAYARLSPDEKTFFSTEHIYTAELPDTDGDGIAEELVAISYNAIVPLNLRLERDAQGVSIHALYGTPLIEKIKDPQALLKKVTMARILRSASPDCLTELEGLLEHITIDKGEITLDGSHSDGSHWTTHLGC